MKADPLLWSFSSPTSTTLLILDRRDDPLTPLLTPWTYQAMVHQCLGIDKNTVNLKGVAGVAPDMK